MEASDIKLDIFRKLDQLEPDKLNEAYSLFLNYLHSFQSNNEKPTLSSTEVERTDSALKETENGLATPISGFTDSLRRKYKL